MKEHGICAKCKKSVGCPYADDRITGCKKFVLEPELELTNEEWLKSLDTEGLVDYLFEVHKGGNSVERQMWIEKHKERIKMQIRGWLKEKHNEMSSM